MSKQRIIFVVSCLSVFAIVWLLLTLTVNTFVQAKAANKIAETNARIIRAVCVRFNVDEKLDVQQARALSQTTTNQKSAKILEDAYKAKKKQAEKDCPTAMVKAEGYKF